MSGYYFSKLFFKNLNFFESYIDFCVENLHLKHDLCVSFFTFHSPSLSLDKHKELSEKNIGFSILSGLRFQRCIARILEHWKHEVMTL